MGKILQSSLQEQPSPEEFNLYEASKRSDSLELSRREETTVESILNTTATTREDDTMKQRESCPLEREVVDVKEDESDNAFSTLAGNPSPTEHYTTLYFTTKYVCISSVFKTKNHILLSNST